MLDFHNILWVIPGFIFISIYNRNRPGRALNLSGWSYIFSLVFIASLTWLPAEFLSKGIFSWIGTFDSINVLFAWMGNDVQQNQVQAVQTLITSIFFSFVWLLLAQWRVISIMVFSPIYDNFYNKCIEWENEEVLLTFKNGKAYHGLLWKYPENPRSRYDAQTISIIPFKSGYRDKETQQVEWNTYYPEYRDWHHFYNMEVIIPRSEILTFGKFNEQTFEYFENKRKKSQIQSKNAKHI